MDDGITQVKEFENPDDFTKKYNWFMNHLNELREVNGLKYVEKVISPGGYFEYHVREKDKH